MTHRSRAGKGSEMIVAGELFRHGLDVYAPMVDDRSIDLVVRVERRNVVEYYEIEVKNVVDYDQIRGIGDPDAPRGYDVLVLHYQPEGRPDELLYLSAEQVKRHRLVDSLFRELVLSADDRKQYREQTLERLAIALREGLLPGSASHSATALGAEEDPIPLSADTIQLKALAFTVRYLGDAIRVGQPRLQGGEWHLDLRSHDGTTYLGEVVLNRQGRVMEERSATHKSVNEICDATGSETAAA